MRWELVLTASNIILILIGLFALLFGFQFGIRKLLRVEQKKWFSYNHVNSTHKKLEWILRISFLVILGTLFVILIQMNPESSEIAWYFQPWIWLLAFFTLSGILQVVMEKKYAENPRAYIASALETIFNLVVFIIVIGFVYNLSR